MAGVLNRYKSKCYQIAKHWRSDSYGHEKEPSNDDPCVIRGGFEPPTDCLEGSCSIQLSYQTKSKAVESRAAQYMAPLKDALQMQSYDFF